MVVSETDVHFSKSKTVIHQIALIIQRPRNTPFGCTNLRLFLHRKPLITRPGKRNLNRTRWQTASNRSINEQRLSPTCDQSEPSEHKTYFVGQLLMRPTHAINLREGLPENPLEHFPCTFCNQVENQSSTRDLARSLPTRDSSKADHDANAAQAHTPKPPSTTLRHQSGILRSIASRIFVHFVY